LESLKDHSCAPIHTRKWEVTNVEEERIIKLRKEHLLYGKKKIKRLYFRFHGEDISTWKIERVIRKHKLYPDPAGHKRLLAKRARGKENPRLRVNNLPKPQSIGSLWHLDSIILNFGGIRRAIITGIDDVSKIAYGRMYVSDTSKYTKDFVGCEPHLWYRDVVSFRYDKKGHNMGKSKRKFESDFKLKVCQEITSGIKTRAQAIQEYSLVESVMAKWLYRYRRLGNEAFLDGNNVNETLTLKKRISELEKSLGRKTLEVEILQEALKLSQVKRGPYTSL